MDNNKTINDDWVPIEQIRTVLNRKIVDPFINSIRHDEKISLKLSNAFVLLRLSENLIVEFDKNITESNEEIIGVKEKNLYISRLWVVIHPKRNPRKMHNRV